MSYIDEICIALIQTLDRASFHKDERLAGYAANLDFWVGEIRHCLDCIEGYERRFARLVEARQEFATGGGRPLDQSLVKRTTTEDELRRLQKGVKQSATKFLRACARHTDFAPECNVEAILGIRIHKPPYSD